MWTVLIFIYCNRNVLWCRCSIPKGFKHALVLQAGTTAWPLPHVYYTTTKMLQTKGNARNITITPGSNKSFLFYATGQQTWVQFGVDTSTAVNILSFLPQDKITLSAIMLLAANLTCIAIYSQQSTRQKII